MPTFKMDCRGRTVQDEPPSIDLTKAQKEHLHVILTALLAALPRFLDVLDLYLPLPKPERRRRSRRRATAPRVTSGKTRGRQS